MSREEAMFAAVSIAWVSQPGLGAPLLVSVSGIDWTVSLVDWMPSDQPPPETITNPQYASDTRSHLS